MRPDVLDEHLAEAVNELLSAFLVAQLLDVAAVKPTGDGERDADYRVGLAVFTLLNLYLNV